MGDIMFSLTNDSEFQEMFNNMNKSINDLYNNTYVGDRTDIKLEYTSYYNGYTLKDIYNIVKLRRLQDIGLISKETASKLSFIYLKYIRLKKDKDNNIFMDYLKEILEEFGIDDDINLQYIIDTSIINEKKDYNTNLINETVNEYGCFLKKGR